MKQTVMNPVHLLQKIVHFNKQRKQKQTKNNRFTNILCGIPVVIMVV